MLVGKLRDQAQNQARRCLVFSMFAKYVCNGDCWLEDVVLKVFNND